MENREVAACKRGRPEEARKGEGKRVGREGSEGGRTDTAAH